jgi:O-antigen ligase
MYYGEKVSEVNAHNWILHLLAEVGIIGFAATLVLIIVFIKVFISKYNSCKSNNDLNSSVKLRIGLWTFILFLVHNLVEASANSLMFGYANVAILLIIILGICIGGVNRAVDY